MRAGEGADTMTVSCVAVQGAGALVVCATCFALALVASLNVGQDGGQGSSTDLVTTATAHWGKVLG